MITNILLLLGWLGRGESAALLEGYLGDIGLPASLGGAIIFDLVAAALAGGFVLAGLHFQRDRGGTANVAPRPAPVPSGEGK